MCNQTGNPAYDGYGVINKALWGHRGFRLLSTSARLAFLYLITGPEVEPSGLFEIAEHSLNEAVGDEIWLSELAPLVEFGSGGGGLLTVWVHGMYEGIKDNGIRMAADEQVRMMPVTPLRDEFMKHNKIAHDMDAEADGMLEAIASVTAVSALLFNDRDRGRVDNLSSLNYAPEDVLRLYSKPDGLWYTSDWRGMKGQTPTLRNIEHTIGSLSTAGNGPRRMGKEAVVSLVQGLQQKNASSKDARIQIERGYLGLWKAMRKVMPWRDWLYFNGDIKFKVYEAIGYLND